MEEQTMPNSPKRTLTLVFGLSLFFGAGPVIPPDLAVSLNPPVPAPCERSAPRAFELGEIVEIPDAEAPCDVEVRETGVQLLAVEDGSRPDPGTEVVRDGRGRFYSTGAFGFPNHVALWDEKGNFLKSFGREGDGPGEFSRRGMISIFVDGDDRVHVRDGGPRWTVFSSNQKLLWSVPALGMGTSDVTAILDIGMAVTRGTDGAHYFTLLDSTGAPHRAFGAVPDKLRQAGGYVERKIAYSGGDGFWAAPLEGGPDGYQVEEWGIDGKLRRGFRRTVDWFPPGDPTRRPRDEPPPPHVDFVHIDDSGLFYIGIVRATDKYRSGGRPPTEEEMDEMAEVIFEIIDTRSGTLLVSKRGLRYSEAISFLPHGFFRRSKDGFRYRQGDSYGDYLGSADDGETKRVTDLLPVVEIVSVELVAK